MIPAYSYESICDELAFAFRNRYPDHADRLTSQVRLVGVLFARPESKLSSEEVLPHLPYLHHRSADELDIFCGGYGQYPFDRTHVEVAERWYFSIPAFDSLRREIEGRAKWRYSGGVDLIITNGRYEGQSKKARLDFSSAIAMNLDKAKADGAIQTIEMFIEKVCQLAEKQKGDDPTWWLSDQLGLTIAKSGLKGLILSLLPKGIEPDIKRAFHVAARDISSR